jgi:hypothetical protein
MVNGLLAGAILAVVDMALAVPGRRALQLVKRSGPGWAVLAWVPSLLLGALTLSACIAALGAAGTPVAVLAGLLVFEIAFGATALQLWANSKYRSVGARLVRARPAVEQELRRSRLGRFIWRRK